jgi:hypothetical protein
MPVNRCQSNKKKGYKWGKSGKCYTGQRARSKAKKQGVAITISKIKRGNYGSGIKMKRAKPTQHKRRLKSGKVITVNKGVAKKPMRKRRRMYMGGNCECEECPSCKAALASIEESNRRIFPERYEKDHPQTGKYKPGKDMSDVTFDAVKRANQKRRRNYSFMFNSTNFVELAKYKNRKADDLDILKGPDGKPILDENGKLQFVNDDVKPHEVLKFVDIDRGIREMRDKKVNISPDRERLIRQALRRNDYIQAHEALPREGKMFANLARGRPDVIVQTKKERRSKYI